MPPYTSSKTSKGRRSKRDRGGRTGDPVAFAASSPVWSIRTPASLPPAGSDALDGSS